MQMYVDRYFALQPMERYHGELVRWREFGSALGVVGAPKRRRKAGQEAGRRGRSAPLAQRTEASLTLEPPCSGSRSRDRGCICRIRDLRKLHLWMFFPGCINW